MSLIKRNLYKMDLKRVRLENKIAYSLLDKNSLKVNILTSPFYKNKVKEDLYLQKTLLKNNIACQIVSWNDISNSSYTVIRSAWGYHKHLDTFKKYLDEHLTINDKELVLENMDKKKQYELLKKNKIPVIDTTFINKIDEVHFKNKKLVIKPIISAGGDDTYLIEREEDFKKCQNISNLMVQPFIEDIDKGEISVIIIDKEIRYGIVRYPGVLSSYQRDTYLDRKDIPTDILEICNKIISINEYQNAVFMRVDLVLDKTHHEVLEVELVDPDLFIETIPNISYKKEIYQVFVNAILDKVINR